MPFFILAGKKIPLAPQTYQTKPAHAKDTGISYVFFLNSDEVWKFLPLFQYTTENCRLKMKIVRLYKDAGTGTQEYIII